MRKIEIHIELGGEYTEAELFPDGAPVPLSDSSARYHLLGVTGEAVPAREARRIIDELSLLEHATVKVRVLPEVSHA